MFRESMAGWKSLGMLAEIGAYLATAPTIRSNTKPGGLSGAWLMTVALPGGRPLETVGTFMDSPASANEQPGDGRWARTSANRLRIAFRLPQEKSDAITGGEYWAAGVQMLDAAGQLHGPLEVELTTRLEDSWARCVLSQSYPYIEAAKGRKWTLT
jgi:hypothetical protein